MNLNAMDFLVEHEAKGHLSPAYLKMTNLGIPIGPYVNRQQYMRIDSAQLEAIVSASAVRSS